MAGTVFPQVRQKSMYAGASKSTRIPGENTAPKSNEAGRTPMIVTGPVMSAGVASIMIVRPTMAGSPPNWRCQNRWLKSATARAPLRHSSGVKSRPNGGSTPSIGKKFSAT